MVTSKSTWEREARSWLPAGERGYMSAEAFPETVEERSLRIPTDPAIDSERTRGLDPR